MKSRYLPEQVDLFNQILRTRRKLQNILSSVEFYQKCIINKVAPKFIQTRIKRAGLKSSFTMEKGFLMEEIRRSKELLSKIQATYDQLNSNVQKILSEDDFVLLMEYIDMVDKQKDEEKKVKNDRTISRLLTFRFGNSVSPSCEHVSNLSSFILDDMQLFVLSHGMNFSLPPKSLNRQGVFAEFEVLVAQLKHHKSVSTFKKEELKARLLDIAHSYCGTPVNQTDWKKIRKCRDALRKLRSEESIVILKPDKGSGVVVMDKTEYVQKMSVILDDTTKFEMVGPVDLHDNTDKIETDLRKFLASLASKKQISKEIHELIQPVGSQRPRLYGLPKTHKVGVPLRPILSMIGSAQHRLAKWLTSLIEPVTEFYSAHCVKDSFTFAESIRDMPVDEESMMCSFDVSSLFTNVPLEETIKICADKLYERNFVGPMKLSKSNFIKLMNWATTSVEFSFNDVVYRQIDGVAMGSPLGPSIANIFVGYQEQNLFAKISPPPVYHRYVDDTFVIIKNHDEMRLFNDHLNNLHPNLRFTNEVEVDGKLPFLDVLVERCEKTYATTVYRKPTFTGQYIRWDSFCDPKRKTNLIKNLAHRAKKICSAEKLPYELDFIKSTLVKNGYPEGVINKIFNTLLNSTPDHNNQLDSSSTTDKKVVYLRLPYIGQVSTIYKRRIKDTITRCYEDVSPRIILTSRSILTTAPKDVLPTLKRSNLVYEYTCHCESRYVGRTSRRLLVRVKEHVQVYVRNNTCPEKTPTSSIGRHLRENEVCRNHYSDDRFKILAFGRNDFHLAVLEALYIKQKRPALCVQKQSVYHTLLF